MVILLTSQAMANIFHFTLFIIIREISTNELPNSLTISPKEPTNDVTKETETTRPFNENTKEIVSNESISDLTMAPGTVAHTMFETTTSKPFQTNVPTDSNYTSGTELDSNHSRENTTSNPTTTSMETMFTSKMYDDRTKGSTIGDSGIEDLSSDFWIILAFTFIISILAIVGNGLVIYASIVNKSAGPFRYIDEIITSLGVADLLLGCLGNPFIVLSYYMGKTHEEKNN